MRISPLIICMTFISGCATGYQSHTWTGGYKDTDLGDGKHFVEYLGNGTNSPAIVLQYWHQRSSELCPGGYQVLSLEEGANNVQTATVVGAAVVPISSNHPWAKGQIRCK